MPAICASDDCMIVARASGSKHCGSIEVGQLRSTRHALPFEPGTFERLQDEIYQGVIDTHDDAYPDGYRRVVAVTKAAQDMTIAVNPIAPIAQTQDRRGICHQLVNDDRLKWTP